LCDLPVSNFPVKKSVSDPFNFRWPRGQSVIDCVGQTGAGSVEPAGMHPGLALAFFFGFALGQRPDLPWLGHTDISLVTRCLHQGGPGFDRLFLLDP
jgi:hypothetical protein